MKNSKTSLFILISTIAHVVIFGAGLLIHKKTDLFQSQKTVIQPAIRVDMVGLPDIQKHTKKSKPKSVPKTKPVPVQKKKAKVKKQPVPKKVKKKPPAPKKAKPTPQKPKPKPQKEKSVSQKTKSDPAPKKDKPAPRKEESVSQKTKSDPAPKKDNVKKGNKVSQGVDGGTSEQQMKDINIYLTLVIGQIKLNWNLPKYLVDGNYLAQLEVKINDKGLVTDKKIVTSSENELFDSKVLKAIEASTPFPPPPDSVKKLISDGIVFTLSSKD